MSIKLFSQFILESKFEMLDVSIPLASKVLKTQKAIQEFLKSDCLITEKMDGIKVNILRNIEEFDPEDYSKNWIISYKGFILYPFEHESVNDKVIKQESYGNSQFKFIHQLLKKAHKKLKDIPKNTEFFLEYLMKKPTLTQSYGSAIHSLVLISHAVSHYTITHGKITTQPAGFNQRDLLAKEFCKALGIQEPEIVFDGPLTQDNKFNEAGITYPPLKEVFNSLKEEINQALGAKNWVEVINSFQKLFTQYPSSLGGGIIEGSVVYNSTTRKFLKFVQQDQYSKEKRQTIKTTMVGEVEESSLYFKKIEEEAEIISNQLDHSSPVETTLKEASKIIYQKDLSFIPHSKKTNLNKQDDLYLKTKVLILDLKDPNTPASVKKGLKNKKNLGFFVGKLRIPTLAHFKIIKEALKVTTEGLILALVDTKKPGLPFEERKTLLEQAFPLLRVVKVPNANFNQILEPFKYQVDEIYCGEDNQESYKKQLDSFNAYHQTGIHLKVIPRAEDDEISATQAEQFIKEDDIKNFKKITPPEVWPFIDSLKTILA